MMLIGNFSVAYKFYTMLIVCGTNMHVLVILSLGTLLGFH